MCIVFGRVHGNLDIILNLLLLLFLWVYNVSLHITESVLYLNKERVNFYFLPTKTNPFNQEEVC